ncbi:MAG: phosphotransferase [Microbacterium sp.]|uniref:phosphotransferase n=1 Tax=Microbacterium sp. TaxID=51671 RepID=UPI003A83A799
MARSPLTLAAAVTSALPRVGVVAAGPLTAGGTGRFDSAVVTLDDRREVVVRAPVDAEAARDLAAEALALRALTSGVRGLLGVRAPELLGDVALGEGRALVTDLLPGYQVEAAHLPGGPGAAVSVGQALASVHALPASVVRSEGLPVRTPEEVRHETTTLLDRAEATGRVPRALLDRWRGAAAKDDLWRFESTVILGGAGATSFLFQDTDAGPAVTGMLDWHALAVGDPATDLRWLASAPQAADDVFTAYHDSAHRAPDTHLRSRARLYAELEFAQWLVHGSELHRTDIMDDAAGLLDTLAGSVHDDELVPAETGEPLDDAMAALDRVPQTPATIDTSMQTDAYDPAELAAFLDTTTELESEPETSSEPAALDDTATAPIDLVSWVDAAVAEDDDHDAEAETERASREALRRWAASE